MGLRKAVVTHGEFAAAGPFLAENLTKDSREYRTLELLGASLKDWTHDAAPISFLDGELRVSCTDLDAVIKELSQMDDPPVNAKALRVLKRCRALLAEAEAARAPPQSADRTYVTHAELYALEQDLAARDKALAIVLEHAELAKDFPGYVEGKLDHRLERILQAADEYATTGPVHVALKRFVELMNDAARREGEVTRRRGRDSWSRYSWKTQRSVR